METKIITYGTSGYSKFIKNFYLNLKQIGIANKLRIYCLDEMCYEDIASFANCSEVIQWIPQKEVPIKLLQYGEVGFAEIMAQKIEIVSHELCLGNNIIYSDSDIFLYENPIPYLEAIKEDCSFMLDWNGDACAGFFYAKSTWLSKLIFSPRSVENLKDFDQTLINAKLNWEGIEYNILDAKLFCNGPLWLGAASSWSQAPIAVHYNAMQSSKKVECMQRYGHWLVH